MAAVAPASHASGGDGHVDLRGLSGSSSGAGSPSDYAKSNGAASSGKRAGFATPDGDASFTPTSPLRHARVPHSTSNAIQTISNESPKHERRVHGSADAQLAAHAASSASSSSRRQENSSDLIRRSSSRRAKEYMGEDELLALVVEIKLQAESAVPKAGGAGNDAAVAAAASVNGKAPPATNTDTIDLCHRKIQTLPEDMIDIIKDDLVRLALGYNFISSLPSTFVNLSRLRYLNVRANYLTSIPDVVTRLPALEILDISRNKIRALPEEPGKLLDLRVLSISNNRLKRIPTWMAEAKHLRILKIESNPLVWPPASVATMPSLEAKLTASNAGSEREKQAALKRAEDRHMLAWINSLRGYLAEHTDVVYEDGMARPLAAVDETGEQSEVAAQNTTTESSYNLEEKHATPDEVQNKTISQDALRASPPPSQSPHKVVVEVGEEDQVGNFVNAPQQTDKGPEEASEAVDAAEESLATADVATPSSRQATPPVPANKSEETATDEATVETIQDADVTATTAPFPDGGQPVSEVKRPGHVATVSNSSESSRASSSSKRRSTDQSHDRSQSTPSQDVVQQKQEAADAEMANDKSSIANDKTISAQDEQIRHSTHGRTNSQTMAPPVTPQRMSRIGLMRSKKSLPDLRQNHGMILMDRRAANDIILEHDEEDEGSDAESESKGGDFSGAAPAASTPLRPRVGRQRNGSLRKSTLDGDESHESLAYLDSYPASGPRLGSAVRNIGVSSASTATAIESERNSYFKRLSTLPASSISKSISVPVLQCVDATRGVLYALSQVHTALKHYVTFATDERMTSQLSRVLDIAGGSMANLIRSLDRFDSLSRTRGGALDPNIVRGVLTSCIESIVTFRKLVHVVHVQLKSLQAGADARYSRTLLLLLYGSLGEIAMNWSSMEPLLDEVSVYLSTDLPTHISTLPTPNLPSIAESTSPTAPASARTAAPPSRPQRRRHAGSFSAKDVAHGATMTGPLHSTPASEAEETRKPHRPPVLTMASESRLLNYQAVQGQIGSGAGTSLNRQRHDASAQLGSADSKRRLPGSDDQSLGKLRSAATPQSYGLYARNVDSASLPIDDHLLMLVVKITSIAFSVWAGIEEHLVAMGLPMTASSSSRSQMNAQLENSGLATADSTMTNSPSASVKALDTRMRRDDCESSMKVAESLRGHAEGDTSMQETRSSHGDDSQGFASRANVSPTTQRKLRQLFDLMRGVHEHTHRLQACLERAQDATALTPTSFNSPPPPPSVAGTSSGSSIISSRRRRGGSDAGTSVASGEDRDNEVHQNGSAESLPQSRRPGPPASVKSEGLQHKFRNHSHIANDASHELFSESGHFIKSVLQISQFIKSLAAEGLVLPKHVKATIAELTTCARDLTLHLHFLSGPTPLQMPMSSSASAAGGLGSSGLRHAIANQHTQHGAPASLPSQASEFDKMRALPSSASATNYSTGIPQRPGLASVTSAPPTTLQHG